MKNNKLGIIIASVVIVLIIIGSIVIYNNHSNEKDAPYGPGTPATETLDSVPVETKLQLNN